MFLCHKYCIFVTRLPMKGILADDSKLMWTILIVFSDDLNQSVRMKNCKFGTLKLFENFVYNYK